MIYLAVDHTLFSSTKMTGSNPLLNLRLIVKDLVDSIGHSRIYTQDNKQYQNAPTFDHLDEEVLIQELVDRISKSYGRDLEIIIIEDAETWEKSIYGMYTFFPEYDIIHIVVNANMNYCWKKFSTIKELCHFYVDFNGQLGSDVKVTREDNYLVSLEDVFEETEKFKDFDFSSFDDIHDIGEEMYIVLLATELMLPIYSRGPLMDLISKIGEPPLNLTTNDVAKSLLMPEYILQKYINLKAINCNPKYTDL